MCGVCLWYFTFNQTSFDEQYETYRFIFVFALWSQVYLDQANEETGPKTGAHSLTTPFPYFCFGSSDTFLLLACSMIIFDVYCFLCCVISALNPDKWLEFKLQDTARVSHNTQLFRFSLDLLILWLKHTHTLALDSWTLFEFSIIWSLGIPLWLSFEYCNWGYNCVNAPLMHIMNNLQIKYIYIWSVTIANSYLTRELVYDCDMWFGSG